MRAMNKNEMAMCAGVSSRTFSRWLAAYKNDLLKLGVTPKTRLLPPKAVMFLSEMLGIDVGI